ncbi:purine-nucleoside phosphorylase [Spongiivirga sp. MCCC 1A20706]|uniref:purine-nucleoside phosphorylase n=1 Tax=Spongiivirga sp. MCCC 1A20706 TaxID=3160963 RepID=UPI0039772DB6
MSIHIDAKPGEIADTVLIPGDPLRAKWIADTFFKNSKCYNRTRGMLGYTGLYNGKPISVQGSGMGIPSAMIYFHELINEYNVKKIIRVGTAGSYQPNIHLRDVIIAMAASTNSNFNNDLFSNVTFCPTANFNLLNKAVKYCEQEAIHFKAGNVLSSDTFYESDPDHYKIWASYGVLCVEMETAVLYTLAAKFGIEALSILTISDSLVTKEESTPEERENSFSTMVEIALGIV